MEIKLYEDLKFCWRVGYKLNQIKDYCNTPLSIEELQVEFKKMWENELQNRLTNTKCEVAHDN